MHMFKNKKRKKKRQIRRCKSIYGSNLTYLRCVGVEKAVYNIMSGGRNSACLAMMICVLCRGNFEIDLGLSRSEQ